MRQLFAYPFRIFFLSAALLAALAVPWWAAAVTGAVPASMHPAWHAHELLYGFLSAAIAGFLLTAVCRWTDSDPVAGLPLLGLYALWLLPRLATAAGASPLFVQLADLAFLPLVILAAARPIVRVRQWRQLPLLAALTLFWLCDLAFHGSGDARWLHGGLLLGALLVVLVGSRITPAFSRNWLRQRGGTAADVVDPGWLAWPLYGVFLLLLGGEAWAILAPAGPPAALTAAVSLAGAALLLLRLLHWRGWRVWREPLLWILHLGVLCIVPGLVLRGLAAPGLVADSAWLHLLGVGALAVTILGVMARVSLGHTGRPLVLARGMVVAFSLLLAALAARVAAALGLLGWQPAVIGSALTWFMAFALYLWYYSAVLWNPRPDGRPG
ncbi:MAG: NnrS family protein [Pseudohaliea sp.]